MSAWDIAGAVVWTPCALLSWWGVLERVARSGAFPPDKPLTIDITWPALLSILAVYCIARLRGAHR